MSANKISLTSLHKISLTSLAKITPFVILTRSDCAGSHPPPAVLEDAAPLARYRHQWGGQNEEAVLDAELAMVRKGDAFNAGVGLGWWGGMFGL